MDGSELEGFGVRGFTGLFLPLEPGFDAPGFLGFEELGDGLELPGADFEGFDFVLLDEGFGPSWSELVVIKMIRRR